MTSPDKNSAGILPDVGEGSAEIPDMFDTDTGAIMAERRSNFRWIVLAVVALTYMVGSADRANLAVALPYIKRDFHLTNAQVGLAASVFFLGVTVIQIPGSLLMQKLRLRSVMIGAIFFTSLATLLTGMANSASHLLMGRTLLGIAEGPLPVGGLTMIDRWFPPRERATAVGIFVASFKTAPALVPPISALIIYAYGWREVFYFFAIPGVLLVVLWYLISDDPRKSRKVNEAELDYIESEVGDRQKDGHTPSPTRPLLDQIVRARTFKLLDTNAAILRTPSIWGCAIAYMLMSGLNYAILTWVPTYLVEVKKFQLLQMGIVASAPWVGAVFGSLLGGLLSDRVFGQRRKPVMMVTAGSTVFTMFALIHAPNHPLALGALLMLTGFLLSFGYSTFTVYPMGFARKANVPFAVALVSTLGAIGGGTAPIVVGFILDHSSWGMAFAFLSTCSVMSFLIVAAIIEPRPASE